MRRIAAPLSALVAVAALLAGCGGSSDSTSAGSASPSASKSASVTGTINVFAAASLQEAFTKLGTQFEAAHPGTKVVFSFGPSSGLAEQIGQGAPGRRVRLGQHEEHGHGRRGRRRGQPHRLRHQHDGDRGARRSNPAHITTVDRPGQEGREGRAVPGRGAVRRDRAARCSTTRRSRSPRSPQEVDVKSTLTKVTLGEVDAGVVYVTDVRAAGAKVKGVEIPADVERLDDLPDRRADRVEEQGHRAGVRRLRAVPGRARGPDRGRVQQALSRDSRHATGRRP